MSTAFVNALPHRQVSIRVPWMDHAWTGHVRNNPIGAFVAYYHTRRYHENLSNLTPADVYHGRGAQILKAIEEIKKETIRQRRLQHQSAVA